MARFRSAIHVQEVGSYNHGVIPLKIPPHVYINVSAGMKYLLFSPIDKKLPLRAYHTFANTLRWKYKFMKKDEEKSKHYDPDYDLGRKSNNLPPPATEFIESGLAKGEVLLRQMVDAIPAQARHKDHDLVDVKTIEKWLIENKSILLPTDKNLGVAAVTREWYLEKCYDILSDTSNYVKVWTNKAGRDLIRVRNSILDLASMPYPMEAENEQLREWLISRCTEYEAHPDDGLPHFYGIPKIHKSPWKMRPIVPCHSALQGPTAKMISKLLRPIVDKQPYVLRGSKDLCKKLANVRLPSHKKVWIISGDVVAYYPNIPREAAKDIALEYMTKEYLLDVFPIKKREDIFWFWSAAIDVANDNLYMRFQNDVYRQLQGLAMGVACSPDMANLYGARWENDIVPQIVEILFYGRYIDDVLSLVVAETKEEALEIASRIVIKDCEIIWEASPLSAVFLDLFIMIDPWTGQIAYKPYRKALNHFERIPWASHHPSDVKKGTLIGEITRMATLSSTMPYYEQALEDVRKIYLMRGYPLNWINTIIKKHATARWRSRLEDRPERETQVHVLKTVFNPVWGYVDIHAVQDAIFKEWALEWNSGPTNKYGTLSLRQLTLSETLALPKSGRSLLPRKRKTRVASELHNYALLGSDDESDSSDRSLEPYNSLPVGMTQQEPSHSWKSPIRTLLDRPLIVSRKRNTSLGDLANQWRKVILRYNQEIDFDPAILDVWH